MYEHVASIATICARKGIRTAVISPGSRSALLTVHFARHPEIRTLVAIDERSAAYIALGIAQQTDRPVALVCTSGTAVLNYAPAVAEAFYLKVPLLCFTADRPPEWIGQQDGQAIRQHNAYGPHAKQSFELPVDCSHPDARWHFERIISEAINCAAAAPAGPVQVNAPFREPFYPSLSAPASKSAEPKVIDELAPTRTLSEAQWAGLTGSAEPFSKVLVLVGQTTRPDALRDLLKTVSTSHKIPVIGDILSNVTAAGPAVSHIDSVLASLSDPMAEALKPDLLITCGDSVLSKNVKGFLRAASPRAHWHIQEAGPAADTFQALTRIVRLRPADFFREWLARTAPIDAAYGRQWAHVQKISIQTSDTFWKLADTFSEFRAIRTVMQALPAGSTLHLGNSMPVRYASLVGIDDPTLRVYANRGTAGIDGSMSTAVGHAMAGEGWHTLILGDSAFLYDRNALLHAPLPSNLRIVVINNGGGGIFRLIDGPAELPEVDRFFVAKHPFEAAGTARDAGLKTFRCEDDAGLAAALEHFFATGTSARLLEIVTDREVNVKAFNHYRRLMRESGQALEPRSNNRHGS